MNQSKNFRMDSSEWELSKENVQPIKQGRKVPNLMAGLAPNGEDAHWKLQKDKQSFEAEIRTYDGEDTLDVWYSLQLGNSKVVSLTHEICGCTTYVLWIEENIPKGGREISTLLERCIQQFKDVTKYKCDERYLQVWIKYADCCMDPLDVFNYMHSQGISCDLPLFYITWASACENAGNYKKADQVLTLAIERNVQPRDMLKKYHIGFQHRLTTYLVAKDDDDEMESLNSGRSALGSLKATGKKKSVPALRTANVYNHQADNAGNSSGNSQNVAASFSVFKDSDNENRAVAGLPDAHGDWKEPPAQSIISKENVDLPGKWTKGKPSSRSGGSSVSSVRTVSKPNFHVHVEENAAQQNTCGSQVIGSQVLASRKPDSKEMNNLLKDIVKNEDEIKVVYKEMYDKRKVYTGTEEFQFEEIRAAKYAALTKHGRPLPAVVRRIKREQEGPTDDAKEYREIPVYQKEKVYAYEGEFQPEEIMARLFYERGGRLRLKKPKVHEAYSMNEGTSSGSLDLRPHTTASKEVEEKRNLPVHTNDDFVKYDDKEITPKRKIKYTDENSDAFCNATEKQLVERFSALDVARHALKEVTQLPIPDEKSDNNPSSFALCSKLPRVSVTPSKLAGPSPTLLTKQALGDVMPWFNTTIGLNDSDTEFEAKFKNDPNSDNSIGLFGTELDGKYVFAGVGRENDIDGMQDENEENLPPIGYVQPTFGRQNLEILQPSLGFPIESFEERQSREEENRQFIAEYEDRFNVKSEITARSESAVKSKSTVNSKTTVKSEGTAPLKYETNKHYEDDITDYQLQFTAAARLASSPFEEQADLRALPTFHCSTIHPSTDLVGASEQIEETPYTAETEPAPFNIPPPPSFNTPSKGLSPILECSDEDGKKERSRDVTVHSPNGDVLRVVNPFDPEICNDLLSKLREPVNTFSGYHDLKDKPMAKISASKAVDLGEHLYRVGKNIGSGAFAKVFSAKRLNVDWTKDDEEKDDNSRALALKVQAPANEWEFYVCSELHRRLKRLGKSEDELSTLVKIEDFYVFADGSCAVTKLHEKGTFLDLVNYYKGRILKECVAVYYAIEFMKILECVHEVGIIHGDIKPDNLVIIGGNSGIVEERGVALIDFGCAIDIRLFPPGTRFSLKNNTESFECIEMKTGRPWTTQVDTYGMLCCLHCLIFGEYMKVYEKNGRWRTTKSINRSWNRNLWTKLFDVFLNIPSCDELPSVKVIYEEFRNYFDGNLKSSFSSAIQTERNAYM